MHLLLRMNVMLDLYGIRLALSNWKQAKNSKSKFINPAGLKPATFCTAIWRFRLLSHSDLCRDMLKSLTKSCQIKLKTKNMAMVQLDMHRNYKRSVKICICFASVDVIINCFQNLAWTHQTIIIVLNLFIIHLLPTAARHTIVKIDCVDAL